MNGSGEKLFKAISSNTRLSILESLNEGDKHISGLAREIGISVPVAAKHIKILEKAELIERKKVGNTHMIGIKLNNVYSFLDHFAENRKLEVKEGTTLLEALKSVTAVEVTKMGDRVKVVSTDGEEGFYVYEVDGKFSDKTVDEYVFNEDVVVEWKKLVPHNKKKIIGKCQKIKTQLSYRSDFSEKNSNSNFLDLIKINIIDFISRLLHILIKAKSLIRKN